MANQGLNENSNPKDGIKNLKGPKQEWPGKDNDLRPKADHGEETYVGAGKLKGKKALITGGDSGIGRAVAIAFAREGADVAFGYFNEDEDAAETLKWIQHAGVKGYSFAGDLENLEACRSLVRDAVEALGGLDIVVNNAAFQEPVESLEELKPEILEKTFKINFYSYVYVAQAALKYLEKGAVILNTTSVNALRGHKTLLDYSATKAAILNFTKSLAPQLAEKGIRINAVAPGPVWTPLIASTMPDQIKKFGHDTLWERAAQPIEIATSFVFLASDDARYFTGQVLSPTGSEEGAR